MTVYRISFGLTSLALPRTRGLSSTSLRFRLELVRSACATTYGLSLGRFGAQPGGLSLRLLSIVPLRTQVTLWRGLRLSQEVRNESGLRLIVSISPHRYVIFIATCARLTGVPLESLSTTDDGFRDGA